MEGYMKLFRSMLDWEWYSDTNTTRLWIHILLKANYKSKFWKGIYIPAGSLVTSLKHLSEETGLTEREVRTALKHLKSTHEVTHKVTRGVSVITVEKWRYFQVDECRSDTGSDTPFDKRVTTT